VHNYWLRQHGFAGEYRKEAVAPENFAAFVAALAANGYAGANVTIPHKETALALSSPDDRALAVGSANTLWHDGGNLKSTNTDVEGFLANLDDAAPGWDKAKTALLLGAGGSARAVVFGLKERGLTRINVANRTAARAQALREKFGDAVVPVSWQDIPALLPNAGLLVNTTSLGMHGQPALDIDIAPLPDTAVVTDLVYVPLVTSLLQSARVRGLRTADGLGMLLHQAVRGFSLWFGVRPVVTAELRQLVEADLAKS
ncbi:MAG TPA: shikimate dehydrogenase, partial [Xanthobacteraceae bacterium]|nr:shikimate dehydrogenase [Xanthobacteraceae bacterium]